MNGARRAGAAPAARPPRPAPHRGVGEGEGARPAAGVPVAPGLDSPGDDEPWRGAVEGAPLVLGSVALSIGNALWFVPHSAWRDSWAIAVAALLLAAAGCVRAGGLAPASSPRTRRWPRRYAGLATAAMAALAAVPWLPGAGAPDGRLTMTAWIAAMAICGAAGLAPLRLALAAAVAIPLSAALAAWRAEGAATGMPPSGTVIALGLAVTALAIGLAARRGWQRALARDGERDAQVRAVELRCDAALRADSDKSRFLAIACHDLRQPVHALGLFAATLEQHLQGSGEEALVRNIVRAIDGLDRSFNAMLDISRLDAGSVEPRLQHFPLRDLFRRLDMYFSGVADQAHLTLSLRPGCKWVTSDPQLLERILGNLVQNAIKYTERGGIAVVARTTATHLNVEVWDTGVGIRESDLPRIFEEFCQVGRRERARVQGLGMGLAIVKRLVTLLGYPLTVRSRPGRGTMFRVAIPIGGEPEVEDATAAADTLPMPAPEPRTILVLDDEDTIREGLAMLLEEWGYTVIAAASARQAERLARTLSLPPDLILSDLRLGDGPDGLAAIEAVRRECGSAVPAIVITGETVAGEIRRVTKAGHALLSKPVEPRKLLGALRTLVD